MVVMARETWTDERLDDLNETVEQGIVETREEFRALRQEVGASRKEISNEILFVRTDLKEEIAGARSEMSEVRREIGALNRTIHQFAFAMVGTVFLGFCGTIAALFSLT